MHIRYGDINLNLVSINEFSRQAVYMGKNYCYSKFRLNVRCWLNPVIQGDTPNQKAPSRHNGAGGLLVGGNANGPLPVISDVALRHDLMQPRQQLVFTFLGTNSLVSPLEGFKTDATGGPIPIACNVQQITPKTWIVDWVVETAINESYLQPTSGMPIVLAQMFSMKHALDEDYFTTRIIKGQALFRVDALVAGNLTPDDFRALLFVIPPAGFKREKVIVENDPEEPGLIRYEVVDRQLPFGWYANHVSRLKARHSVRTTKGEPLAAIGKGIQGTVEGGIGMMTGESKSTVGGSGGSLFFSGMKAAADLANPISIHHVDVEVWGDPRSVRDDLEAFARQIIQGRLAAFFNAINLFNPGAAPEVPPGENRILKAAWNFAKGVIEGATKATMIAIPRAVKVPFGVDSFVEHDVTGKYVHVGYAAIGGPLLILS